MHQHFITGLNEVFKTYQGENTVTFEVLELERVKKAATIKPVELVPVDAEETDEESMEEMELEVDEPSEEVRIINQLVLPSRKVKVKISNDLLSELAKFNVDFRFN